MINKKHGKLTVIGIENKRTTNDSTEWICLCECGNKTISLGSDLIRGHSSSCGCKRKETLSKIKTTHGMTGTSTHNICIMMKQRCKNKNNNGYKKWYGKKGISVCERWNIFHNFYEDMGERPVGMTIERINNDGDYEPSNCRWASQKEQANNKKNNVFIRIGKENRTVAQWCEIYGVSKTMVYQRISKLGWKKTRELFERLR